MPLRKVIVIGLDGLEPKIVEPMLDRGELPNLSRLRTMGGYCRARTTFPAQTPVAWSTFATGTNPGGHGIFDFIHRDPATMVPYLSTTTTQAPGWNLPLGRWRIPLWQGDIKLNRKGRAFCRKCPPV